MWKLNNMRCRAAAAAEEVVEAEFIDIDEMVSSRSESFEHLISPKQVLQSN
jgi:hypothetical protein